MAMLAAELFEVSLHKTLLLTIIAFEDIAMALREAVSVIQLPLVQSIIARQGPSGPFPCCQIRAVIVDNERLRTYHNDMHAGDIGRSRV